MKCLKDRGICKEAEKIQANEVEARIEEMLRGEWTVTEYRPEESIVNHNDNLIAEASIRISETREGAISNHGDGSTKTSSSTFGINRNPINALLNPTAPTQSQQLSSVGSSSVVISSGAGLSSSGQDFIAGEHAEFGSRGEKRGLESQLGGSSA
ncbi:af9c6431-f956-4c2b-8e78-cc31537f0e04 [Sclerotinia trifoliorum]|uniref:Af9c6431-f956-4c2b-8e78-cc31537f0e04 n=1 Tax=Sclerotinia trifoliorum TaxID=28548 RepID=A0A8H2ZKZ3_9HELO|nr:af9c6431-f956-4c2b-8e78-cc31537f0e04 [Sclerotinia trifoliorum]